MTPNEAIGQAKNGRLLALYVVVGEERFLRDEVVAALRTAALGNGVAAFNEDKFTAGEVDAEAVVGAARTVPMMAPKRFVLVRGIERWDSGSDSEGGSDASSVKKLAPLDRFAEYAGAPIDSTCLVLTGQKIDGRKRLSAIAKKQGFLVVCDVLGGRELPGWIRDRASARGNPIDPDVAELLAEIAGPELAHVNDAVERLALYAGEGKPITEDAVSACVARVRTADTWDLVAKVGARDLKGALAALADAYDPRDRGLPLLGALAWSIRQLARFQAATESGASTDEAARRAGVYQPFRARELAQRAKALRPKEMDRWLLVLAETDLALKGSRRPPQAILEDMLTRLCTAAGPRGRAQTGHS
ncbi:DNA polymerase III subunit delta [Pendulispora albinea]|uniref:DNA polymerase III subunit delta n=1 Tax=Pendulispora albinea TaxID=2741071 RepID=A0ABZ2M2L0_9BACT